MIYKVATAGILTLILVVIVYMIFKEVKEGGVNDKTN